MDLLAAEARQEDGNEHAQEVVDLEEGVQQYHRAEHAHQYPARNHGPLSSSLSPSFFIWKLRGLRKKRTIIMSVRSVGGSIEERGGRNASYAVLRRSSAMRCNNAFLFFASRAATCACI